MGKLNRLWVSHQAEKEPSASTSHFPHNTGQELWEAFRTGSEEALVAIYNEHYPALFHYAHQFTTDRAVVKDCIQELFLTLQVSRNKLGPTTSIRFYLMRSLRRLLTRHSKETALFIAGEQDYTSFSVEPGIETTLIQQEASEEMLRKLECCLNELPVRQREAIYYFFYENFSYQQIAELMGFGQVKSARTLVYRALDSLRESLGPGKTTLTGSKAALPQMLTLLYMAQKIGSGVFAQIVESA